IICGKKNNFYHQLGGGEYLASYVWNQWRDGTPLEVLDPAIVDSYSRDEVLDACTFAYFAFRKIRLLDPPWQL
ncbi:hypothetical protein NL676_018076, partial [Syzygium grande]